jgi:hypothetical protein
MKRQKFIQIHGKFRSISLAEASMELQNGDILFQDLGCGPVHDAINGVTPGYADAELNHCGIVRVSQSRVFVIEAISPKVHAVPIDVFLNRSVDSKNRPTVMVGRVTDEVCSLVPAAVSFCVGRTGLRYDPLFMPDEGTFYCSELIVEGFRFANGGNPVFPKQPMTFKSPDTGEILPFWIQYYSRFGVDVPEGVPGSNPGTLSLDPRIRIVDQLGSIRGAPIP